MDRARYKRKAKEFDSALNAKKDILREKFGVDFIATSPWDPYHKFTVALAKLTHEEVTLICDQLDEFTLEKFYAAIAERQQQH